MEYDKIIIGEDNGIYGGIQNVYFHNYNTKPVYKINSKLFDIKTDFNPIESIKDYFKASDISGINFKKEYKNDFKQGETLMKDTILLNKQ